MKTRILAIAAALILLPSTLMKADEGMWLLPLLEKINADAMKDLGLRLTPEQIYSINNASIKDAVCNFGGGCTGEIISDEGLLVTNHHCGYGQIVSLSTTEHNYLEDGFFAMSRNEEIPCPGLTVTFLQYMTDVTGSKKDNETLIAEAEKANPNCTARVVNFFNGNVQYLVVSKTYRDVRFVGAPPASSGKFGGDTDNWTWPRHTCDFSMFRVYAGKDNEPAAYSEENVPFVPKKSLSVSLKGVQPGDFAMIMGYPGTTRRYQTAAQLEEMIQMNDIAIDARGLRQDVIWEAMRADEQVNLMYASKYSGSSNGWKKYIGMKEAFGKLDVIERQKEKEAELATWVNAKKSRVKDYGTAVSDIAAVVANREKAYRNQQLLSETLGRIELFTFASLASAPAGGANRRYRDPMSLYENYSLDVDRQVAKVLTEYYLENVEPDCKIDITLDEMMSVFDNSVFVSAEKYNAAKASGADLTKDPASVVGAKISEAQGRYRAQQQEATAPLADASKAYAAALLDWTGGTENYPDANSTCRLTYGTIGGYSPKDAVEYSYYTTLKGVMEKEDPNNYEFRVPAKLKEIYQNKDYGQYANEKGELVTCFLGNLDITGGNSGSPVLDADGNLIGLAFDGNWEAMSGDIIFEPELQRCICVDIRYVLLMVDKFGGAGYLIDEMNIIK